MSCLMNVDYNYGQKGTFVCTKNKFLYFFAYFICGMVMPALLMIVTVAIYDVRESDILLQDF